MCGNLILTESRAIGSFYFIFLIYTIIWTLSCFCIFLAKNGVFNTNRTTGEADDPQAGVNEINAERSLRHIYGLSAWLVTQGCRKLHERSRRTEHHALMSRLRV